MDARGRAVEGVRADGDGWVGSNGILSVIKVNCMGSFVRMWAGLRTERGRSWVFGSVGRFEL
jgi:hypothetical protein